MTKYEIATPERFSVQARNDKKCLPSYNVKVVVFPSQQKAGVTIFPSVICAGIVGACGDLIFEISSLFRNTRILRIPLSSL